MHNSRKNAYDVVIIGSGPNGLSAGIFLAQKGLRVHIIEAKATVGGALRTEELTLPCFRHDVGAAVHPTGFLSPYFRTLNLEKYGLEWVHAPVSVAHPLDGEPAVILEKSLTATAENLGKDARAYLRLMRPLTENPHALLKDILKPLGIPESPLLLARFGLRGALPAELAARLFFKDRRAKALLAGCAAHSILPFDKFFTTALGLVFPVCAHTADWPVARGGSASIAAALLRCFEAAGGTVQLEKQVTQMSQLPPARAYLFDTDPRQLSHIAGEALPTHYHKRLQKFNYGPGIFKIDYALNAPIPWRDPNILRASTVHLGGTFDETAACAKAVWQGRHSENPYVLLAQQSQFDGTRAPAGQHTCWAYCHVPFGSERDMSAVIEAQIERFAPGFRDTVIARHGMNTKDFQAFNPNFYGGAITGGASDITQLFTRPVARLDPYSTPNPRIFIGSASTPPGGGVHGMCGYYAGRSVWGQVFGRGGNTPKFTSPVKMTRF